MSSGIFYPLLIDIGWSDSAHAVKKKLHAADLTIAGEDEGDIAFRGALFGYESEGWVYFAHGDAVKVLAKILPTHSDVFVEFQRLKRILSEQFGSPQRAVDFVEPPFHHGDGRTLEALAQNKGAVAVAWTAIPEDGNAGLVLRVAGDGMLRVSAEGPKWGEEVARRAAAGRQ